MIPIYSPFVSKSSIKYVEDAIATTWIGSTGKYKEIVTDVLKDRLKIKHILLVNNGTSACHLVSKAIKYKYPNINRIITPNNVYVAAINAFLFDNFYNICPIDADIDSWNFDIKKIPILNEKDAILAVHNVGNIINIPKLKKIFYNTVIVEDNCEGLFGKYDDKYSGTESFCSSISFHSAKTITCGEGGAFLTNDSEIMEVVERIHGQGQSEQKYIHNILGYNYRMTNIQAAILLGQLESLNEILEKKEYIYEYYKKNINYENIFFQKEDTKTEHSKWMMGIRVLNNPGYFYAKKYFDDLKIEIRPMFFPLSFHKHIFEKIKIGEEKNANILSKECFFIPSYPNLNKNELKYISDNVINFAKGCK